METLETTEKRLLAEIEGLRVQYSDTQDLYREVCVILFFRHGITPTANKLYQLVRKGSMSAPADALNRFWETLREKSRLRIEHPDLPESLRDAAGEMVGALWQRAQAEAKNTLSVIQEESEASVQAAQNSAEDALLKLQSAETALESSRQDRLGLQQQVSEFQTNLARVHGEMAAQQRQIDLAIAQRQELQQALATAREQFTRELEQQRTASVAAEERHAADMKRMLLDVDRERVQSTKMQKELEQSRRALSEQMDNHRMQLAERQTQVETLRHSNGELEGIVVELRGQRDQMGREIESLRQRLEALPVEKAVTKRRVKRDVELSKMVKTAK
jgi:chromosome segregation ATPase